MAKKVVWLPYDMDTAIGINNEGDLVFSYNLEDIDKTETGADVYNGQESVIWKNMRDAFGPEMKAMYQSLRSSGAISYEKVEQMFEDHQEKWPEAIFNEDAMFKYIDPLINDGTGTYLSMLQGSKEEQRKWWLYNRFRYLDSKYNAGDAASDVIQIRGYAKSDVTITPYADVYATVKYGSYLQQVRASRNIPYTLPCPLDNVNDTEIYIYSASQLASVGDLSGFKVGLADFSKATKLQEVKVGDADPEYTNENLGAGKNTFTFGNNTLLKVIDARNCVNLGAGEQKSVDISHCTNIEEVYFEGTKLQSVVLPNGGVLKKLHLPGTITNLTIINHKNITDFVIPSFDNVSSLRLENVGGAIDEREILGEIPVNTRVRLIGFQWECEDSDEIDDIIDILNTMRGMDEFGNTTETAQVSGTIHTAFLTGERLAYYQEHYPYLNVTADHTTAVLRYYNYNGTELLYSETVEDGGNGGAYSGAPARTQDAQYTYAFIGWSRQMESESADTDPFSHVVADRNVYAAYTKTIRKYTVRFLNNGTPLYVRANVPYGSTVQYSGATPEYAGGSAGEFEFSGWLPTGENITGDTDCIAQYLDKSSVVLKYLKNTLTDYESETNTVISDYAFYQRTALETVTTPATTVGKNAFGECRNLAKIDLTGTDPVTIWNLAFYRCYLLTDLIIRSSTMATLSDVNAFSLTPIKRNLGAIYVPTGLVNTYKMDTKWSAYRIASIDEYPIRDYSSITDSWEEIFAAEEDGTYSSKYVLGDTKKLTVNGQDVYMEIVAFDTDELTTQDPETSGTDYAKITWVAKDLLPWAVKMNSTATNDGGWASTELRAWLINDILPTIDSSIRSHIKEVNKTYFEYGEGDKTIADTVWIPSAREMMGGTNYETTGCTYPRFNNFSERTKHNIIESTYWLRTSSNNTSSFRQINSAGAITYSSAIAQCSVLLGFCT